MTEPGVLVKPSKNGGFENKQLLHGSKLGLIEPILKSVSVLLVPRTYTRKKTAARSRLKAKD
jgi:hypothetical protein